MKKLKVNDVIYDPIYKKVAELCVMLDTKERGNVCLNPCYFH